jgi:hypothetical protein
MEDDMRKILAISVSVFSFVFLLMFTVSAEEKAVSQATKPTDGWTLHVDAKKHFPKMPDMIAHHYCKQVSGGLYECQLYDSDKPDARLIGVEVIVDKETWKKFPRKEKSLWHYHKTELLKVEPTLPDVSAEEGAKTLKSMEETYGKVYILWNPASKEPTGRPMVSILR